MTTISGDTERREGTREVSAGALREAFPEGGLFEGMQWVFSPKPFVLEPKLAAELETLGHRLKLFQEAADALYFRSFQGKLPGYIAGYLDGGKPDWMVAHARDKALRGTTPRVIRPDLILTQEGFAITELDSVPGGIGLTAWLNRTYADLGEFPVIGGTGGMTGGFRSILPRGGDILVSEESGSYRPEMEWLVGQLGDGGPWDVVGAENYRPQAGRDIYRFFELFDHANIGHLPEIAQLAVEGSISVTPTLKPHLEEKLWAALFWLKPLENVWAESMRGNHLAKLREMFPYSWVVDPAPVPHHAVIPRLGIQSWDELADLSQKERELVLKISGFSELAWGSRGVSIGHDMPADEWKAAVENAVESFPEHPYVLQDYRRAEIVEHPYWDPDTGERRTMKGRVRLCPYYFTDVATGKTSLGGVLATIVPADKKIIHGMTDAILVPCVVGEK